MEPKIRRLILRYSIKSAVVSVIAHPVPAVDEIFVIPVHYGLSVKMAMAHKARILGLPWRQVHKIIWGGAAVRFCIDVTFGLVPIAGLVSHTLTAVTLTQFLGQYLDEALRQPGPPPPVTLQTLKDSLRPRVKTAKPKASSAAASHRDSVGLIRGKAA
jgi:hypothetical protein